MTRGVKKTPDAKRDLVEISVYIGRDSLEAARRFRQAAQETFRQIAAMPGIGQPCPTENPELAGMRCVFVTGFSKYLVFYRPAGRAVEVVRVVHGARDLKQLLGLSDEDASAPEPEGSP
jgi:toxin ParE1/3/4